MPRLTTSNLLESKGRLVHVCVALSALLFVSPWILDFAGLAIAARTAWISAIVIAVFSLAAAIKFAEWKEWVTLAGGVWLVIAPWVLGFAYFGGATAAFTGVGCFIIGISVSDLWTIHGLRRDRAETSSR